MRDLIDLHYSRQKTRLYLEEVTIYIYDTLALARVFKNTQQVRLRILL